MVSWVCWRGELCNNHHGHTCAILQSVMRSQGKWPPWAWTRNISCFPCFLHIACLVSYWSPAQFLANAGTVEAFIVIVVILISLFYNPWSPIFVLHLHCLELAFVWFNLASSSILCCCGWWSRRQNHMHVLARVCTGCVGARLHHGQED
jgi:hypothetical protein